MSSVIISGNTSGTVTLFAPDVAGTTTLTLPTTSGTVLTSATTQAGLPANIAGNGPAFSAYMSATQSVTNATVTAVQFNTDSGANGFDTASCYDTSTYRFTPNVAGYYQFSVRLAAPSSDTGITYIYIMKNGTDANNALNFAGRNSASGVTVSTSGLLHMNGSTDYVQVYCYQNTGTSQTMGATGFGYANFQGVLVRAA